MLAETKHLGLAVTLSTAGTHPYHTVRRLSTLDRFLPLWIALSGTATIIRDDDIKRERWTEDLGRWYAGLIRDQFDLDDETRKLAQSIVRGKTSELDKVAQAERVPEPPRRLEDALPQSPREPIRAVVGVRDRHRGDA